MPKRKKAFIILAFPIAIFLWIIGWGLYSIGSSKKEPVKPLKPRAKPLDHGDLTFIVPPLEHQEVENN
jgi:hypothetical protein